MEPWTLQDASNLVRAIQDDFYACGFFPTVGGNVLYLGRSQQELSLYSIPLEGNKSGDPKQLVTKLAKAWGKPRNLRDDNEREDSPVRASSYRHDLHLPSTGSRVMGGGNYVTVTSGEPTGFVRTSPAISYPPPGNNGYLSEPTSSEPDRRLSEAFVVFEEAPDSLDELRRSMVEDGSKWRFNDPPSTGSFRYSLRFFRGSDVIDLTII